MTVRPWKFVQTAAALAVLSVCLAARADLEASVEQVLRGASLGDTTAAVVLYDLDFDETRVLINADEAMIPASNQKLLTTAAALAILGPDYQFATTLLAVPAPPAALASVGATPAVPAAPTLVLVGSGDPALGDAALLAERDLQADDLLDLWVQHVVDAGHRRYEKLLVDDRVFDRDFVHPDWPADQLNRDYCAQVAGLNFHGNCLYVLPVPADSAGLAPTVQVYPFFPELQTVNRATTGQNDAFWITRDPHANVFTFRGTVRNRRAQPFATPLHDPPMVMGHLLARRLRDAGVEVGGVARISDDAPLAEGQTLFEVRTTLASVLDRTNQDSENLFAEALFKRLGHELTGAPGSFNNGAAAIRVFLQQHLGSRVNAASARPVDGSGLARGNRVTARVLAETLRFCFRDPALRDVFRGSLARTGRTGTLARRLDDTTAEVYGKSGYISRVCTLSGYLVYPPDASRSRPRTFAFAILMNDFPGNVGLGQVQAVQDRIVRLFDEQLTAELE